jgi:hypothetical protein
VPAGVAVQLRPRARLAGIEPHVRGNVQRNNAGVRGHVQHVQRVHAVDVSAQIASRTRGARACAGACVAVNVTTRRLHFCTGILYFFFVVLICLPALACGLAISALVLFVIGSSFHEVYKLGVKAFHFAAKVAREVLGATPQAMNEPVAEIELLP